MTVSLVTMLRCLLISVVLALAACVPSWGQTASSAGTYFAEPGSLEAGLTERLPTDDEASNIVATSWDDSSWLLERNGPPSQTESRPGFMGRLADLARGRVMLEGGYAYVTDSSAGTTITEHVVPDLLLRVGVTERIEVRIGWPGASVVNQDSATGSSTTTTTLDPNVGLMMDLWSQQGWLPQTAILGSVPITLGGNRFAMSSLQPVSALLYQWSLTDRLSVGGDSGLALYRADGDHYLQWQQSVDADYLLTDRVGLFSQWQALADDGSDNDATRHMVSLGASWLCTDRLQITWRAGVGLNDPAPDFLADVRFGLLF
jgi:outer membrane putative beta-barrel porin/alpha-amylase